MATNNPTEETANYLLNLARLFHSLLQENSDLINNVIPQEVKNPPASKQFMTSLNTLSSKADETCSICLENYTKDDLVKELPKCKHYFHAECILPWLENTNTCPVCRQEYPTDDFEYEEKRRLKENPVQREEVLEDLHNSMYC